MADVFAQSAAGGNNCRLDWTLVFNDVADTVTITSTHKHFDGSPAPDPQVAIISTVLQTGQTIGVDLLTGLLLSGQAFDGTASKMINSGPRTRSGVRLKVSADRAASLTFSTEYTPPA